MHHARFASPPVFHLTQKTYGDQFLVRWLERPHDCIETHLVHPQMGRPGIERHSEGQHRLLADLIPLKRQCAEQIAGQRLTQSRQHLKIERQNVSGPDIADQAVVEPDSEKCLGTPLPGIGHIRRIVFSPQADNQTEAYAPPPVAAAVIPAVGHVVCGVLQSPQRSLQIAISTGTGRNPAELQKFAGRQTNGVILRHPLQHHSVDESKENIVVHPMRNQRVTRRSAAHADASNGIEGNVPGPFVELGAVGSEHQVQPCQIRLVVPECQLFARHTQSLHADFHVSRPCPLATQLSKFARLMNDQIF